MLTGALAASYYGTPRTTVDVDVVVKVSERNLEAYLFTPLRNAGLRVNEAKIKQILKSGYRIITFRDPRTPLTVDVILYDKKLHKKAGTILGLPTFYQTPEDLILSKLRMIKATVPKERALKDKNDVTAILKQSRVDFRTLKKRAREENTLNELTELIAQAET